MADITFNGMTMEFDFVAAKMEADLKSEVAALMGDCTEQELLDTYMKAHKEKYGSDFLQ